MSGRLDGRIALITGSASGIGQATAIEFAREGADVVVHYLNDATGAEETRQAVEAHGRRAIVVQADISDEGHVGRLFDEATREFDRVDILMNKRRGRRVRRRERRRFRRDLRHGDPDQPVRRLLLLPTLRPARPPGHAPRPPGCRIRRRRPRPSSRRAARRRR